MVEVKITKILEDQITKEGLDYNFFIDLFSKWKCGGASQEHSYYEFGKDGAYNKPKVNDATYVLKHVHLVPIIDLETKAKWDAAWKHNSRKTSNRVLVYAGDGPKKFLLIAILPEPDAHSIASMKTSSDVDTMTSFSQIAEEFIFTGNILA